MSSVRMPLSSLRAPACSQPSRALAAVRLAAAALGATVVAAAAALLLMFAGLAPFGPVNDVLNGVIGWLAFALALAVWSAEGRPQSLRALLGLAAAAGGAVFLSWGAWLVVSGTTGYVLAGLVSTLGLGCLGLWLVLGHTGAGRDGVLGSGPARLGRVMGALMTLGVFALPSALAGVDEQSALEWHGYVAQGPAWLGAAMLPVWCYRLARQARSIA